MGMRSLGVGRVPSMLATALLLGLLPSAALACGDPTDDWYESVSDVVFEATARCSVEQRSCSLRVHRIVKNPLNLELRRRPIEVDYQNWYTDFYAANPDEIIIVCGVPLFEPDQERFRARFYANLDQRTSELIVRRARLTNQNRIEEE